VRKSASRQERPPNFSSQLSWRHYLALIRVKDPQARAFYEIEAARECWSTRELERQIASLLFHRLAKSRSPDQVQKLARQGQEIATPQDVLKEPLVLEFLDLGEQPGWRERGLESALIDRLGAFMLELGKGFCFVARQKRISLDGDHFFVDLAMPKTPSKICLARLTGSSPAPSLGCKGQASSSPRRARP